jgi:hypothetical protein
MPAQNMQASEALHREGVPGKCLTPQEPRTIGLDAIPLVLLCIIFKIGAGFRDRDYDMGYVTLSMAVRPSLWRVSQTAGDVTPSRPTLSFTFLTHVQHDPCIMQDSL